MEWREYTEILTMIERSFGSYDRDYVRDAYKMWKPKHRDEFFSFVQNELSKNVKPDLLPKPVEHSKMVDRRNSWKDEIASRKISDGFLDKILNENGSQNLLELVLKEAKKEKP